MAADVSITMEAQNKGVIQAMDQVGKKADQLNRKTQAMGGGSQRQGGYTQGMGVLEVSRAIEDAQYGIRGVLNNIPGIIQSFGGSMGLAGVISITAVALSLFGKALLEAATGMDMAAEKAAYLEARTNKMAEGLAGIREKAASAKLAKEISAASLAAEEFVSIFVGFNPNPESAFEIGQDKIEEARSAADRLAQMNEELNKLRGVGGGGNPIDIGVSRAAEDAKALETLVNDLSDRGGVLGSMLSAGEGNPVAAATSEIERMNLEIAKTEAIIAGSDAEMKSLEEQAKSMGITVKQYLTDLADMAIRGLGSGDALDELKRRANASGPEAEIAIKKSNAESELRDQEKRKKILEDQLTILKAQSDDVAKQKELRDKEIAANQKSLEDAKRRLKSAQAELATQKALLEKRKEIEAAKLEANIKGNLEGFRMNPSDMLSSSGRIGGSVKEYSSAVATVNYQRDTLKALKEIARNSRTGKVSTYK
jgi:hypothetical protein